MNAAYDLIAAAARYWFIALAALILFQLICALRREARMEKKVVRQIDRAGVRPAAELWLLGDEEGRIRRKKPFFIEEETTVGRSRKCDLALRTPSLERVHGILTPVPEGLMLTAVGRAYLAINGREAAEGAVARDGDEIQLGGLHFELRLGESDAY